VSILLTFIHLLFELLCFLLVSKGQAGQTVLELKGVEKGTVLVVLEGVVDFLVPDDAAIRRRDVDHLDPKSVADEVVGEDYGALQAGILPSVVVWICNVQLCDSDSMDLVGSLGDLSLDILLVVVG